MKSVISVAVPEKNTVNGITKPFLREESAISEVSLVTQESASVDNRSFRYHESARSIVFRDTLRHENHSSKTAPSGSSYIYRRGDSSFISYYSSDSNDNNTDTVVDPLPKLPLTKHSPFLPLISQQLHQPLDSLNTQERHVVQLLQTQMAVVKTIKNSEWSTFLRKFVVERSFRTSTSLLPPSGQKMRCFGSTKEYTVGVVFALPTVGESEDAVYANLEEEQDEINRTQTWCWPSGYAAKTEFNVDKYGNLINGRKEALLPIQTMREYNHSYLIDTDHMIGGRLIRGGLSTVPYNEIMVRVGNRSSRLGEGEDHESEYYSSAYHCKRSYADGVGYPVALFVRAAHYADLVMMIRIRARMLSVLGSIVNCLFYKIPLLFITPEHGVHVFTHEMQLELYQSIAQKVNPFRNPTLYKTDMDNTSSEHLSQKIEELIDLSQDEVRSTLTRKERMMIAGGFGATDESIFLLLMESLQDDDTHGTKKKNKLVYSGVGEDLISGLEGFGYNEPELDFNNNTEINSYAQQGQELQRNVTAGLEAAVRAGDYHTARQLLILYTLVASHGGMSVMKILPNLVTGQDDGSTGEECALLIFNRFLNFVSNSMSGQSSGYSSDASERSSQSSGSQNSKASSTSVSSYYPRNPSVMHFHSVLDIVNPKEVQLDGLLSLSIHRPPPLDTSRLRAATNSSGLLVVLGAAHILKGIYDGSAKQRMKETIEAVDEWVENGENSVVFRLSSWNSQRTAQADLNIAIEHDTQFTSFIGKHAIENRKKFTALLRNALAIPDSDDLSFLRTLHDMLSQMHRPCLRLELLQFILELDNRYSVAQLTRSVKLASTCLVVYMHDFSIFDDDVNGAI
jgi:hypothetical protein